MTLKTKWKHTHWIDDGVDRWPVMDEGSFVSTADAWLHGGIVDMKSTLAKRGYKLRPVGSSEALTIDQALQQS